VQSEKDHDALSGGNHLTVKNVKNIAASVRERLLNISKTDVRPFQEVVQYYAMERFLYRLSQSQYANRFVLKGALMLHVWKTPGYRSTMDVDLLGRTDNDMSALISNMADVLSIEVEPDGLFFSADNITADYITEDAEYKGVRIWFPANLDTIKLNMQIDIGFGDIVYPGPEKSVIPTMLEFPSPLLFCYSRESAISEKFEAMLKLRDLNSRMKDFYDIWLLSRNFGFEGKVLSEAIRLTLEQRGTELPDNIVAFSNEFITNKQIQWNAFRKKLKQDILPFEFEDIVMQVKAFLNPIALSLTLKQPPPAKWAPPGPWL
jgi:hypothetical protein